MQLAVVVSSNDAETAWNAFRFAVKAAQAGHTVRAFLLGAGVECEGLCRQPFDVVEQMEAFRALGGEIRSCGTCLRSRGLDGSALCPVSTMQDLLDITLWADRVLTF